MIGRERSWRTDVTLIELGVQLKLYDAKTWEWVGEEVGREKQKTKKKKKVK